MGRFYSDAVEQALTYIYYDVRAGRGNEGLLLLMDASAKGDGDASCVLVRCLCGSKYVWDYHNFPVQDAQATALLHKSVAQKSAIGVLVCLRTGELSPALEKTMPFDSLQEAFEIVLEIAQAGDAFAQYTIGNTYFWWDFLRIQGKGRDSFTDQASYEAYMRENISQCEGWFQKALKGGIHFAANNLFHYYQKGDEDIIPPQPQKAEPMAFWRSCAQYGHPRCEYFYAQELDKAGRKKEALEWYQKAAEGGELDGWYYMACAYEEGDIVNKDLSYAARCYEKGLGSIAKKTGCHNGLGALYYKGEGVEQDYGKAREFLEQVDWDNKEAFYMLGVIYCQGLGVDEDIKRGVEYLKKAGDDREAKEELIKYKKTLFGKWVRR